MSKKKVEEDTLLRDYFNPPSDVVSRITDPESKVESLRKVSIKVPIIPPEFKKITIDKPQLLKDKDKGFPSCLIHKDKEIEVYTAANPLFFEFISKGTKWNDIANKYKLIKAPKAPKPKKTKSKKKPVKKEKFDPWKILINNFTIDQTESKYYFLNVKKPVKDKGNLLSQSSLYKIEIKELIISIVNSENQIVSLTTLLKDLKKLKLKYDVASSILDFKEVAKLKDNLGIIGTLNKSYILIKDDPLAPISNIFPFKNYKDKIIFISHTGDPSYIVPIEDFYHVIEDPFTLLNIDEEMFRTVTDDFNSIIYSFYNQKPVYFEAGKARYYYMPEGHTKYVNTNYEGIRNLVG